MSAVLETKPVSKYHNRLTPDQKQAVIAAVASGQVKLQIAKDFGVRPETISRILRDVKKVDNPSNPLSRDYRPRIKDKALRAIERGLDYKGDPIGAMNGGIKVMSGIGEFVQGSKVEMNGSVAVTFQWGPVQKAEYAPVIDVTPEKQLTTDESTPTT